MAQDPKQKKKNIVLGSIAAALFLLAIVIFVIANREPVPEVGTAEEQPEFLGSPNRAFDPDNPPEALEEETLDLETGDQE